MRKAYLVPFILFAVSTIYAVDLSVSGNGANSTNTVNITNTGTTTVSQGNNATVVNDVTAKAGTGNNTTSGNNGNSTIVTGNATTQTNITNTLNSNTATVPCSTCDGQVTPTPDGGKPTATPTLPPHIGGGGGGSNPPSQGGSSNSPSNPSSGGQGDGGGQREVLGLSATHSNVFQTLSMIAGLVCLSVGSILLRKSQ